MNPLVPHQASRWSMASEPAESSELLAEETAIALLFNGVPYAVMMATPADLHDFAVGFALSEGIIESASELAWIEQVEREAGLALHLKIPSERFAALEQPRRLLAASGCGLCGSEHLEQVMRSPPPLPSTTPLAPSTLLAAVTQLHQRQPLNAQCGALHAAAAIRDDQLLVREDVGRHNAVDKVIGALGRAGRGATAMLVTSRASYELVHKVASARIPALVAVSAPTAQAVRLAEAVGLCLVAFARESRLTVYAGKHRLG